jgi:hypothetical protein
MTKSYNLRDAKFIATNALPAAAGTGNGTALDLGNDSTANGARLQDCELLLSAPALATGALPDTVTATYSIECSSVANFATTQNVSPSCVVQTGNTGAAAATFRAKLPTNCLRYVRAKVVTSTNAGNCAASSMTLELLF